MTFVGDDESRAHLEAFAQVARAVRHSTDGLPTLRDHGGSTAAAQTKWLGALWLCRIALDICTVLLCAES